ncbi:MAG TPA: hypothetical protein VEZ70_04095 [Allosphingosinicella sp.]|nr:hypothetical protein [Allosphingosinicella sp.]
MLSGGTMVSRSEWPVPHAGMPPIGGGPPLSPFEFWPPRLFYLPVWAWVIALSIRHRGVRLPLIANPLFPAGGLYGESKSQILDLIGGNAARWIAPYVVVERKEDLANDVRTARALLETAGLGLPLVAKPDLGCRGAGVRPLRATDDLEKYLQAFPVGERLLLQRMVDQEGEAGIFYIRLPGEERGEIFSLTLKYFPYVIGDGASTLEQLIMADPRAGALSHLYLPRHADWLNMVLERGHPFRLAFAGSHSRGAIFRDGTHLVTEALRARIDEIARSIPEFWFGRFDLRFADIEELRRGEGFTIVECNGAGAEATHIWDARVRLGDAYRTLFKQFALLWTIGARNRSRGFRPESWRAFLRRWRHERTVSVRYPPTA